jgi:hypothetical protein
MRFQQLLVLAAAGTAFAAPIFTQIDETFDTADAPAIIAAINAGGALTQQIGKEAAAKAPFATIDSDGDKLEAALKNGIAVAKASGPLSDADVGKIGAAIGTLIPDIQSTLNAIVASKSAYGPHAVHVKMDLTNQKALSDQLTAAINAHASAASKSTSAAISKQVDALFDAAIKAYT